MAIEAQQFTEKDELIAKFYTLRAGLSVIGEEQSEIDQCEEELSKLKWQQNEIEEKYEYFQEFAQSREREISNQEFTLRNRIDELEHKKLFLSKLNEPQSYKNYRERMTFGLFFGLLAIAFISFCAIFGITYLIIGDSPETLFAGTILPLAELLIIPIIPFIVCSKSRTNDAMKELSRKKSECKEAIEKLENDIRSLQKTIQEMKTNLAESDNEYKQELDICANEINSINERLNTKLIPASTTKAKAIKAALNKEFDSLLTEADWKNVDLLIFYLNTGRADSLKEALLLVDQQRQTDQITNAIHAASQHIAGTIRDNTYRLAAVMTKCCEQLSKQISLNHTETLSAINRNTQAIGGLRQGVGALGTSLNNLGAQIESQSNAIISAEQLNASLLAQANQSSDDLIKELRYNQRYWVK